MRSYYFLVVEDGHDDLALSPVVDEAHKEAFERSTNLVFKVKLPDDQEYVFLSNCLLGKFVDQLVMGAYQLIHTGSEVYFEDPSQSSD